MNLSVLRSVLAWLCGTTLILQLTIVPHASAAAPVKKTVTFDAKKIAELQMFLKKSLTIVEIDRSLGQIRAEQKINQSELTSLQREINLQSIRLAKLREQAGKVLRSYYMGSRQPLWMMVFSLENLKWTDLLTVYDYLQLMIGHDQEKLQAYSDAYDQMETSRKLAEAKRTELAEQEHQYNVQRARVVALTAALKQELDRKADADAYWAWLNAKNRQWLNAGLPQFEEALKQLSRSMTKFSRLIGPDTLKLERDLNTFSLPEAMYNEFVQQEAPVLRNMRFAFRDELFKVEGVVSGEPIRFSGKYVITDQPEHGMRFQIIKIEYAGVDLPDTTVAEMQEKYDLGFYPKAIGWNVKLQSIGLSNGIFRIGFKF